VDGWFDSVCCLRCCRNTEIRSKRDVIKDLCRVVCCSSFALSLSSILSSSAVSASCTRLTQRVILRPTLLKLLLLLLLLLLADVRSPVTVTARCVLSLSSPLSAPCACSITQLLFRLPVNSFQHNTPLHIDFIASCLSVWDYNWQFRVHLCQLIVSYSAAHKFHHHHHQRHITSFRFLIKTYTMNNKTQLTLSGTETLIKGTNSCPWKSK